MSLEYQILIIAHGHVVHPTEMYRIPPRTVLHTVPKGSSLYCYADKVAKSICEGKKDLFSYHYAGPKDEKTSLERKNLIDFDVYLSEETLGRFSTGIYVCKDGVVTPWLPLISHSLRETIEDIYKRITIIAQNDPFKIHISLIACMAETEKEKPGTVIHEGKIANWTNPSTLAAIAASKAHAANLAAAAAATGAGAAGAASTGAAAGSANENNNNSMARSSGAAGAAARITYEDLFENNVVPTITIDPRRISNRIRQLRGEKYSEAVIKSTIITEFRLTDADANHYLTTTRGGKRKTMKTKRRYSRRNRKA